MGYEEGDDAPRAIVHEILERIEVNIARGGKRAIPTGPHIDGVLEDFPPDTHESNDTEINEEKGKFCSGEIGRVANIEYIIAREGDPGPTKHVQGNIDGVEVVPIREHAKPVERGNNEGQDEEGGDLRNEGAHAS